ncbi:GNAT family N-acetyltransferase [Chitinophaga varians]|uniref:GNAT family N-acetyltransferase n=1 Tax=Chitinophaga varians TaxID=2202339 RepID=UPI00165F1022|nr:GNAT family N-acetyltransferase [Chitinophaga varians]MBC9911546.1 GNAT family N-acetyltransferase [Chitinophaga varians]
MESIIIRAASPLDSKQLSDLICENAEALLKPHYSREQWDIFIKYYSEQTMAEKIRQQTIFCAEANGEMVGTVALDGDFVVGFYTRLQQVNQGIGKQLMSHLENYARTRGIETLQLAASPAGLAFYYKNGWEKVKDFTVYHYGVGFEETLMTKKLG